MTNHAHSNCNRRETLNGGLGFYGVRTHISVSGRNVCYYPDEESEEHDHDEEPCHDEKVENAALENRSRQPIHARLAVASFELQGEDDNANESNKLCGDVRILEIYGTVGNRYQQTQPATCTPTRQPWKQRRYTLGTDPEGLWAFVRLDGEVKEP
jgi:hypothetical protein